jgi:hypothetical protein
MLLLPQVETGSAITWKYPSVVLKGDNSVGEFYSVALTNNKQQADTGTKMIHVGKNTRSRIVSKGISAGESVNAYRGLVQVRMAGAGEDCARSLAAAGRGACSAVGVWKTGAEVAGHSFLESDLQLFFCRDSWERAC